MRRPSIPARRLPVALLLLGLLVPAGLTPLGAAPVPHPDRPDRLLETRDGLSVEYSPGQEAWMERAFAEMKKDTAESAAPAPAPVAPPPGPAAPGSARSLQENRKLLLAAVARQIGLPKPSALQGRVFDTFLGYYKLTSELMQSAGRAMPDAIPIRHLAIWQRDDLVARLRHGAKIAGMDYEPATASGRFGFNFNINGSSLGKRLREIQNEIEAQKVKHQFEYGGDKYSASVRLGEKPDPQKPPAKDIAPDPQDLAAIISATVFPIIYQGDAGTTPTDEDFNYLPRTLAAARVALQQQMTVYRDPNLVAIILHETAETGLVENVIGSRDRRWLCDGTANYVAWRVARDLAGPEFAQYVYNLDAQLRQYAAHQPKIALAVWSTVERQKEGEIETDLNRAHYAFATRVMFLLTARHGENALAQLWADVARTPRKKVSAKTFADAYRKRFKADLGQLIAAAEKDPIPAAVAPAVKSPAAPTR